MRTKLSLLLTIMVLMMPALGSAKQFVPIPQKIKPPQQQSTQTQSCANTVDVTKLSGNDSQRINKIKANLAQYQSTIVDGHYEVCFQMDELIITDALQPDFTEPFTINIAASETRDVHIIGLNIKRDGTWQDPINLLHVTNASPTATVYLDGIQLSNVIDGISLEGTGEVVIDTYAGSQAVPKTQTKLTGDANKSGTCLHLKSNSAVIKGADISSCAEGVLIEANDALLGAADKDHIATDMNTIHDNVLGIHAGSGDRNKFGYNLVYDNKQQQTLKGTAKDAITIEAGTNENLVPLEVELFDNQGEKYALKCTRDQANNVIQREIRFNAPQPNGIATLYAADKDVSQPTKYLTTCSLDANGTCIIKDLPPDVMTLIQPGDCGIKNYYVTSLFTGTSSTELLASSFEFKGIAEIVAVPVEFPAPTTGVTESGVNTGAMSELDDDDTTTTTAAMTDDGSVPSGAGMGTTAMKCSLTQDARCDLNSITSIALALFVITALLLFRYQSVTPLKRRTTSPAAKFCFKFFHRGHS